MDKCCVYWNIGLEKTIMIPEWEVLRDIQVELFGKQLAMQI